MLELLQELSAKENLVFVGSVAMMLQGIDVVPADIDIVVTDLEGLEGYTEYTTDSKYSTSGQRAFILGDYNIDIFVEERLPQFAIINGLKVITPYYQEKYYNRILPQLDFRRQLLIQEKLELLQ